MNLPETHTYHTKTDIMRNKLFVVYVTQKCPIYLSSRHADSLQNCYKIPALSRKPVTIHSLWITAPRVAEFVKSTR